MMLPPDHPDAPKFWMKEAGGKLGPAVVRYLRDVPEEPEDMDLLRAYFRQWIMSPVWRDNTDGVLSMLRERVDQLQTWEDVDRWCEMATDFGADPL